MSKFQTILGKKNDNEFKEIQKTLLNQMARLDNNKEMKENGKFEIQRSGAISQNASSFVKSVQTQIKILELSGKWNVDMKTMNEFLGIEKSDK